MKYKNFFRSCVRYSYYFIAQLILSYILATVLVRGNTIIGDAIDTMLSGSNVKFRSFIGILLAMNIIGFVSSFFRSVFASKYSIKVQTDYRALIAKKLYNLEYNILTVMAQVRC